MNSKVVSSSSSRFGIKVLVSNSITKSILLFVSLLFGNHLGFSQGINKEAVNRLIFFLQQNHGLRGTPNPQFYFNYIENKLDLGSDTQIPIFLVEVNYRFSPQEADDSLKYGPLTSHFVEFKCKVDGCFGPSKSPSSTLTTYSFPLKSKKSCYKFIELLYDLTTK